MDMVDRAQKDMDFLGAHREMRVETHPRATGYCLFCGEPLPKGERWCDKDCRNDWEKEEAAKRRNGNVHRRRS